MTTFTTTTASGAADITRLEKARDVVEEAVLNLASNTVSDKRKDYAIKAAGDEFARRTHLTRRSDNSLSTVADQSTLSTSGVPRFDPSRLIKAEIEDSDDVRNRLRHDTYRNVAIDLEKSGASPDTSLPERIAFYMATAYFFPVPDDSYTVHLLYWEPFVEWDYGTSSPADVTLNIPSDTLMGVLWYGVPAHLSQHVGTNESQRARQMFDDHILRSAGYYSKAPAAIPHEEDIK